jgi:hypothetical protein
MNTDITNYLKELGKKGGKARAKNLSKEQLHAIAMKGVEARRQKKGDNSKDN